MRQFALRPMGIFLPVLHLRSRISKKILFALLSQCLLSYYKNLPQTKILTKNSNFFAFLKNLFKILILIKFKKNKIA